MGSRDDAADVAAVAAAIAASLEQTNYGEVLAARGVTTVLLDEYGRMVVTPPNGT